MKLSADLVCLTSSFVVDEYDVSDVCLTQVSTTNLQVRLIRVLGSIVLSVLRNRNGKRIPIPVLTFVCCNFSLAANAECSSDKSSCTLVKQMQ